MTTKDEALSVEDTLKLALEALESVKHKIDSYQVNVCDDVDEAITTIREALASKSEALMFVRCVCGEPDTPGTHRTDGPCLAEQPAQQQSAERGEPVAIALNTGTKQGVKWLKNVEHGERLYTSPPASKPLPDEEIDSIVAMSCKKDSSHLDAARVARAIEAAHGIKGDA